MLNSFAKDGKLRVLLVKTTSLGDVVHNFPVVSDIATNFPDARIDWLVDEQFAALPLLHPSVHKAIPVALRRWRKNLGRMATWREIGSFHRKFSSEPYDIAIDTQGLLKSALIMRDSRGMRCGFDSRCAREPLASWFYRRKFFVPNGQHAVERNRQLAAKALNYKLREGADFSIHAPAIAGFDWLRAERYVVLLHATSRVDKCWQEEKWIKVGHYLQAQGVVCVLPWGSEEEQSRSRRLNSQIPGSIVPPRLSLSEAAMALGNALGVVGVDTGLAHLAAALNIPTVGVYIATDPMLTGLYPNRLTRNLGGVGRAPEAVEVIDTLSYLMSVGK
jgi:heptosyltransferase-1